MGYKVETRSKGQAAPKTFDHDFTQDVVALYCQKNKIKPSKSKDTYDEKKGHQSFIVKNSDTKEVISIFFVKEDKAGPLHTLLRQIGDLEKHRDDSIDFKLSDGRLLEYEKAALSINYVIEAHNPNYEDPKAQAASSVYKKGSFFESDKQQSNSKLGKIKPDIPAYDEENLDGAKTHTIGGPGGSGND